MDTYRYGVNLITNNFLYCNYMMTTKINNHIHQLENIIINLANDKHDKRIVCHCNEKDYQTVYVSLDEIKYAYQQYFLSFSDIEYLFYYTYDIGYFCCKRQKELILKYLKQRIKYQTFGKNKRKIKTVYLSTYDDYYVVFLLKKH